MFFLSSPAAPVSAWLPPSPLSSALVPCSVPLLLLLGATLGLGPGFLDFLVLPPDSGLR